MATCFVQKEWFDLKMLLSEYNCITFYSNDDVSTMRAKGKKIPEISGISDLSKYGGSMAPPARTGLCGYNSAVIRRRG